MNILKDLKKNLPYFAVLFGLFALLLITCPAVSSKSEYSATRFSGLEIAFGNRDKGLSFSAMIFTYFVLLSSIACLVLSFVLPKLKTLFSLIAGGCFLLTMILFFCSKCFLNVYIEDLSNWINHAEINAMYRKECTIGAGAVLSAIFCLFASIASVFDFVFDKAKAIMQDQVNKAAQAQIAAASAPVEEPVAEPILVEEPVAEQMTETPAEEVAPSDAE